MTTQQPLSKEERKTLLTILRDGMTARTAWQKMRPGIVLAETKALRTLAGSEYQRAYTNAIKKGSAARDTRRAKPATPPEQPLSEEEKELLIADLEKGLRVAEIIEIYRPGMTMYQWYNHISHEGENFAENYKALVTGGSDIRSRKSKKKTTASDALLRRLQKRKLPSGKMLHFGNCFSQEARDYAGGSCG